MDAHISLLHGRVVPEGLESIETCRTAESRCWVVAMFYGIHASPLHKRIVPKCFDSIKTYNTAES